MNAVSDTAAQAAIGAAARELKLPTVRDQAARLAEIAARERHTHLAYLAEVLAAELDDRTGRRRARRIAEARFPRLKRLADFNTDAVPAITPAQIARLAAGAYLDAGEPVVLLGDSGTGKTHLLIGLGLAACEQGRRVRYATTAQLVNDLVEAADNRALSRVVGRYGRLDLLLLDELGYVQIDPRGAELLFQIITEREETGLHRHRHQPAVQRMGHRVPRPPPRRRDRGPGHLQRPHPRNRHPVLPAPHQQDHQPRPAARPAPPGRVTICQPADAPNAASACPGRFPAPGGCSSTARQHAGKRPTGAAADTPPEPPAPSAAASSEQTHPQTTSPTPGPKFMTTGGAKSLDDTHSGS